MKFGDKLMALRKKNGLSQEELAAKLNVSRQSVSKWESNNSYPETDKIVQICNLFDCNMDDLINDSITNIENMERKNKNNINMVFDSFLEFITKTINMFCDMKFISGLKCVIEMIIMTFILILVGLLFVNLFSDIILNLFSYVPDAGFYIISNMLRGLLSILWAIFALIILIHIFKIRYLNYYDKAITEKDEKVEQPKVERLNKNEKIKLEKKETVVIRDEKHRPFAFLSVCSKIIIFFIKLMVAFFSLFFCASLLGFVISLIVSLSLSTYSAIFVGADIAIVSAIVVNILVLILLFNFIFDKKGNYKIMLITFIVSIFVCGIGIGISIISFKNMNYVDNLEDIIELTTNKEVIDYKDDLVLKSMYGDIEYVIDDSKNNIEIQFEYDKRFSTSYISDDIDYYGLNLKEFYIHNTPNFKDLYNIVTKDLKNNIIRSYDSYLYFDTKVYTSKDNIDKLIDRTKKLYLVDVQETENGYILSNFEDRIINSSDCSFDYDVKDNKITSSEDYCSCKTIENNGRIELICSYNEYDE